MISLDITLHLAGEAMPAAFRPVPHLPPQYKLQGEAILAVLHVFGAKVALLALGGQDVEGYVVEVAVEDDAFCV